MVDIVVGGVPPVQNRSNERQGQRRPPADKKRPLNDRRKKEADRQQEVRFGVVVTLSDSDERREESDRLKQIKTYQSVKLEQIECL